MISRLVSRCRPGDRESGQASMVTVAMFMMLFAAIAVSFTFVVISASRQALNDSLQSSAKIAAESGVEDAKRLIVYCYNKRQSDGSYPPADQKLCLQVIGKLSDKLEDMGCDDILGELDNINYNKSFAVEDEGSRGHRVKVGNNSSNKNENNEYYQCLKIATKTDNYQGMVNNLGKSIIVPLRVVNTQNQAAVIASLEIEWHRNVTGNDGDDPAKMDGAQGTGLPPAGTWNSGNSNRPAVLRVERVGVPKGNFTLDQLADSDTALTLRPSVNKKVGNYRLGDYKPRYPFNDRDKIAPNSQYYDQHGNKTAPIAEAACTDGGGSNNEYACKTTFYGESLNTGQTDYYLRINAIYRSTHFKITAYDQSGKKLYFDGVQPLVDVTGRSSDSFSRIQARLKPSFDKNADSTNWWPEYVIDTNGKVCKDIEVQYDEGEDRCTY